MTTPVAVFDNNMTSWKADQNAPWGELKYKLVQANLARHLGPGQLHVLDAGGGNGFDSLPLAAQGHTVALVDYSQEMLADAVANAAALGLSDRVTIHQSDVCNIADLLPGVEFDLVLCHNVLQYVEDAPTLLTSLVARLKQNGLISIMGINRFSAPFKTAFFAGNLTEALAQLDARTTKAILFDACMTNYSAEEVSQVLQSAECVIEQDYGIRCICDYWGDNDKKSDPEIMSQLERLEFALTDRYPYKLLARFFQVIACKT